MLPEYDQSLSRTDIDDKRRGPLLLGILSLSIVGLAMLSLAWFYFMYRTPDSRYDAVLKDLYAMHDAAETIPKAETNIDDTYDVANDSARREAAITYISHLATMSGSRVFETDKVARDAYANRRTVIDSYGQSSLDAFDTMNIYHQVDTTCRSAMKSIDSDVKTAEAFNERTAACLELLTEYPSVPQASFDDMYYKRLVDAYRQLIQSYQRAYMAFEAQDIDALTAANKAIDAALSNYKEVTSQPKLTVHNSKNPRDQIKKLIHVIEQRKSLFFRH